MKLTHEDAYVFRRIMAKMDIPTGLELSPITRLLIDTLDPVNNQAGWQTLYDIVMHDSAVVEQVMYLDPQACPPRETDDHAYVEAYIQQVTTQTNVLAPDTSRTNGSTALLMKLHQSNQEQGPQAAQQILHQEEASNIYTFDMIFNETPIDYLDEEKIIQAKELTAIVGQPGAGKSFWTLRKLAELADTMPVFYIAAEGINPERLHALVKTRQSEGKPHTHSFSQNFRICKAPVDFTSEGEVELLLQQMGDFKPKVIAIDTFAACTPGIDENSSKDMQPVLNRIRETLIARFHCAVLLIHHTTKDGKSFRGSSALRGNVANMYYLTQDDDLITLRSDKQRDREADEDRYYRLVKFKTRQHPETGEQLYSAAMLPAERVMDDPEKPALSNLSKNQRTILETLEPFEMGLAGRSLEDATGIARSTLWRTIGKLVKGGYICTGEKGEPIYITDEGKKALFKHYCPTSPSSPIVVP